MKKLLSMLLIVLSIFFLTCEKPETEKKEMEVKTGLETDAPVSQEVDTLTEKMDQLMEEVNTK